MTNKNRNRALPLLLVSALILVPVDSRLISLNPQDAGVAKAQVAGGLEWGAAGAFLVFTAVGIFLITYMQTDDYQESVRVASDFITRRAPEFLNQTLDKIAIAYQSLQAERQCSRRPPCIPAPPGYFDSLRTQPRLENWGSFAETIRLPRPRLLPIPPPIPLPSHIDNTENLNRSLGELASLIRDSPAWLGLQIGISELLEKQQGVAMASLTEENFLTVSDALWADLSFRFEFKNLLNQFNAATSDVIPIASEIVLAKFTESVMKCLRNPLSRKALLAAVGIGLATTTEVILLISLLKWESEGTHHPLLIGLLGMIVVSKIMRDVLLKAGPVHEIKKLVRIFFECVQEQGASTLDPQEMILIVQGLRGYIVATIDGLSYWALRPRKSH